MLAGRPFGSAEAQRIYERCQLQLQYLDESDRLKQHLTIDGIQLSHCLEDGFEALRSALPRNAICTTVSGGDHNKSAKVVRCRLFAVEDPIKFTVTLVGPVVAA